MVATTLGRPGSTSHTSGCQPQPRIFCATSAAAGASERPASGRCWETARTSSCRKPISSPRSISPAIALRVPFASVAITDVEGVRVGHWSDAQAQTGCTVVLLAPEGAIAGVDVRGAAPGTRETDLLRPGCTVERAHAVLLTGGSAFGLAAADGVMRWLAERGIGIAVGPVR